MGGTLQVGQPSSGPLNPSAQIGGARPAQSPATIMQDLVTRLFGGPVGAEAARTAMDVIAPATPLGTIETTIPRQIDPNLAAGMGALGLGAGALGMLRGRPQGAVRALESAGRLKSSEQQVQDFMQLVSEAELSKIMKTARAAGAIGQKPSLVTRAALERVQPGSRVLDFGSGPKANQSRLLRESGFTDVTSTDLPESIQASGGLVRALNEGEVFDTVLASNVLNTTPNVDAMRNILDQIAGRISPGGNSILNFPNSPRPSNLRGKAFTNLVSERFENVERIGGTADAPVLKVSNPRIENLPPTTFNAADFKPPPKKKTEK